MSRTWRIYYNIVFGGVGGLLAWLIVGSLPDLVQNDLFWEVLIGCIAGAAIGGLLGAVDGALGQRWSRMLLGALRGAGLGLVGGMIGLAVGEGLFLLTQGGFIGRSIGWGVVGGIIGATEGLANRAPRKTTYGVIGGALGGLIGGALFEGLTEASLGASGSEEFVQNAAAGIGLVLVGACIGSIIALVEDILVGAYFHIVRGKQEGKDFNIVKSVMSIGGDDRNDIPVYDPSVGARFAQVRQQDKDILIENKNGIVSLIRPPNDKQSITSPRVLHDGDRVQIGNTVLVFHKRR